MRIAVASGKGGTGKTMVATSLALSLAGTHLVTFMDCDVEAPNGHLFLMPRFDWKAQAVIQIPQIHAELCSACGRCVEVCQFHALAQIGTTILVFPQLCHGCGTCTWNCPEGAIHENPHQIGWIEGGMARDNIHFFRGSLTISEPMPTPVIRQVKRLLTQVEDHIIILDAPPGASCSVVETLRGSDYVVLVTEPTPFGLHDLRQMVGIIKDMHILAGVIINRDNQSFGVLDEFCAQEKLPILMRIPFDRHIAENIARGWSLVDGYPEFRRSFIHLFSQISRLSEAKVLVKPKREG